MTALTLVPVKVEAKRADGTPIAAAKVRFSLTVADTDGQLVVPTLYDGITDVNGELTLNVWPNSRGVNGSQYQVAITAAGLNFQGVATVPEYACNLHEILSLQPGTVSDAQAAANTARDWAVKLGAPVEGVEYSAKHHAQAAAQDREQADLDAQATAEDRTQTGLDRVQTGADRAAADAAAAAAAVSAAQALAVAQQDLSGVVAAALHRAPGPVTAFALYDTTKDSDPTWPDRITNTGWYWEALAGKWLGWAANEAGARTIAGAVTSDYFGNTTDGKFYKLNAGAGVTEVFRGNKRTFPKQVAIVAEASSVVLYDLVEPGRPMWMVFVRNDDGTWLTSSALSSGLGGAISHVAMCAGVLLVVGSGMGLQTVNFPKDSANVRGTGANVGGQYRGNIAQRNAGLGHDGSNTAFIANNTVNAVTAVVLADAPVDPATGLQVPTVAAATSAGANVIKHDGSVVGSAAATNFKSAVLTRRGDLFLGQGTASAIVQYARSVGSLGAGFALGSYVWNVVPAITTFNYANAGIACGTDGPIAAAYTAPMLSLVKENPSTPAAGLVANITPTYGSGWMCGDIRRAFLCDTVAGALPIQRVVNGDMSDGTAGWSADGSHAISIDAGRLKSVATAVANGAYVGRNLGAFKAGDVLRFKYDSISDGTSVSTSPNLGTANGTSNIRQFASFGFGAARTFTHRFTSDVASCWLWFYGGAGQPVGNYILVDNIGGVEDVPDRSYKGGSLEVFGAVAKTAVAAGSQLVAYGPFSGANYLREANSADLDVAAGDWSLSAWVNYAATGLQVIAERYNGVAAIYQQLYVDAAGKLNGVAADGALVRTVTSPVAYHGAGWLKATLSYQAASGALTLRVNARQVAQVTGAPLGSMNSATSPFTVGNGIAGNAFTGSLALVKFGATVPTAEQEQFIYDQERQMFREGAQITLPDAGGLVDVAYDERLGAVLCASAVNESRFDDAGLVRTYTAPAAAGAISKIGGVAGTKLVARTGANQGVDVTLPAQNLKVELLRRAEDAAAAARLVPRIFDFDLAAGVTEVPLPAGWEAIDVAAAGSKKREGTTKDWIRKYDGFVERPVFAVAPNAWVQVSARRMK